MGASHVEHDHELTRIFGRHRRRLVVDQCSWAGEAFPSGLPPIALAEARLLLGGVTLLLWIGPRAARAGFLAPPRRALVMAVAAMGAFQWTFFIAVGVLGSGMAILVTTAIGPVAAQAIAAARDGNRLGRRWQLAAALLGLAGLAATGGSAGGGVGVLAAVASGVAYAVYAEVAAAFSLAPGQGRQGLVITGAALAGAGLLLAPVALRSPWPAPTPQSLGTLLFLGLAATALAYALFARGLRVLAAEQALSLLAIQPLAALGGDLLTHHRGVLTANPWPVLLVAAAFLARCAPWPLISSRRRGAGTAPRDGSRPQCP